MNRAEWKAAAALTAAVVLVLSGCTSVVTGSAVRAAGGPPPGAVDVSLLDPGNYPTKPRPPLGVAGNPARGALLEAQRMADFVVAPWEVDPSLNAAYPFGFSPGSMPLKLDAIAAIAVPEAAAAARNHNYVTGFAAARQVDGQKQLFNTVLRMADAPSAAAAATEMGQATLTHPPDLSPPVVMASIPIPGHPEGIAVAHSFTQDGTNRTWNVVDSFTAHGPYVLIQRARVTDAMDVATGLVAKTIDLQGPLIDSFAPTDPAQLPTLPRDPSGLLAKSLPVPDTGGTVNNNATFGQHGALLYQSDPATAAKQFADAGVDVAVSSTGWVFAARDAAAASALAAGAQQPGAVPAAAVPNLAGSHCQQSTDGKAFSCTVVAGRYVFDLSSTNSTTCISRWLPNTSCCRRRDGPTHAHLASTGRDRGRRVVGRMQLPSDGRRGQGPDDRGRRGQPRVAATGELPHLARTSAHALGGLRGHRRRAADGRLRRRAVQLRGRRGPLGHHRHIAATGSRRHPADRSPVPTAGRKVKGRNGFHSR